MLELDVDLRDGRIQHAQGLLEQLLAGLVSLEHDNSERHMGEQCNWCGHEIEREDGWRVQEIPGARKAAFCRLEHVVPWSIQGAALGAG